MRVTFVLAHADLCGGVRVIAIYARELQRRGHLVTIISTPPKPTPIRRQIKSLLKGGGWRAANSISSHLDGHDLDHRRLDRYRPVVDADVPDADVVVATWWETAEWVRNLSPRKGAKAYFLQGLDAHRPETIEKVKQTWLYPMHKIVVAQWLRKHVRTSCGDERVFVVPNGVDLKQFHAPARTKQPLPTVGMVYSAHHVKGCDIAVRAIRRVQSRRRLQVIAFGAEPLKADHRLSGQFHFEHRPPQDRLRHLYGACDAWLFASRQEGFGLPILEAMACRTPVIGTPAGAAPELLSEGGGILVSPEDAEGLARAIERIADMTPAEWRRMSAAAHATAMRRTWSAGASLFEDALLETAGAGAAAAARYSPRAVGAATR